MNEKGREGRVVPPDGAMTHFCLVSLTMLHSYNFHRPRGIVHMAAVKIMLVIMHDYLINWFYPGWHQHVEYEELRRLVT